MIISSFYIKHIMYHTSMDIDQIRNSHCCIGLLCVSLTGEWDIVYFYLCATFIPAPFSLLAESQHLVQKVKMTMISSISLHHPFQWFMIQRLKTSSKKNSVFVSDLLVCLTHNNTFLDCWGCLNHGDNWCKWLSLSYIYVRHINGSFLESLNQTVVLSCFIYWIIALQFTFHFLDCL
jgi:hypothetical protein